MKKPGLIDFTNDREELLRQLHRKGIRDNSVLKAINSVAREAFVHPMSLLKSYEDISLPIGLGQTISQPYTVARMTELLELSAGMRVLEIGTGSGYQAAVLSAMGMEVWTIERHEELSTTASQLLTSLGYDVTCRVSDGTLGWSENSPFDRIVVTAGAPLISQELKSQIRVGGLIVAPVGSKTNQEMIRLTKMKNGVFQEENFGSFKFVPLVGEFGWKE